MEARTRSHELVLRAAALSLVVVAALRAEPASWLYGALGVALLVRTFGEILAPSHRRVFAVAYVVIAVAGLALYLVAT